MSKWYIAVLPHEPGRYQGNSRVCSGLYSSQADLRRNWDVKGAQIVEIDIPEPHDRETYTQSLEARGDALVAQLKEVMEQLNEAMTNEGSKDCRIDDLEKALQKFGSHARGCKAWGRPRPDLCTCGYVAAFGGVNAFNQVVEDALAALAKEPTT